MTVYILENNLREYLGHFFNMTFGLKQGFEESGQKCHVVINNDASESVKLELNGMPFFPDLSWPSQQKKNSKEAMMHYGSRYADALNKIPAPDSEDWLVVTTAFQDQIFGVAEFLKGIPRQSRPRVLFYLHWSTWDDNSQRIEAWIEACRRLAEVASTDRYVLAVQNDELRDSFIRTINVPTVKWPVPMYYGRRQELQDRRNQTYPCVSVLGRNLERKGCNLLPGIIARVKLKLPRTRFTIQATRARQNLLRIMPGVEIVKGGSDMEDHLATFQRTDVLLSPYRKEIYVDRTSGLFMEGAAFGCVHVVPAGTWLSQQIVEKKAVGKVFEEYTASSIASTLVETLNNLEELATIAPACADYWWEHQSTSAFVRRLLDLGPRVSPTSDHSVVEPFE